MSIVRTAAANAKQGNVVRIRLTGHADRSGTDAYNLRLSERRAEAKAKGYEGEMCGECGNFTLVRNGTCMKCDTCGSTTGCS